ncbi:alpha/beta hydrolase [Roseomonas sp. OT10]|uniref:alpha/beta hydrolase n=1 Tax=Roseomonas cutis TaxID=2897332 RepID=UPI001E46A6FB|nr:alpha/beta hydrolase [Roseomonas sp. OT10]UFN50939.1 alpha/beta hydrolase [Roseomonas sp. OT10]
MHDPRWDPEMLQFQRVMDAAARPDPIPDPAVDLAGTRRRTEWLNLPLAAGGPAMAESRDLRLPLAGREVTCRLHRPRRDAALPVLLFLHGGGWAWNSIDTHDRLTRVLALAGDCAVLAPDYALAPEHPFPQGLEESLDAARWVARQGADLGLDGTRLVIGGDSAGANLALAAALRLRETDPGLALAGLLLAYGVYDAGCDTPTYAEFAEGYGLTRERMRLFWRLYAPEEADRRSPLAAPLAAELGGLPPVVMPVAELDVLRGENEAMAARLRAAGVPVEWHLLAGTAHGFLRAQGRVAAADAATAACAAWLRRRWAA